MSWQLAAFTILGLALIAGFAWYERSRPDARIVALVATLAALAALGRIAFAALPNVKPTTDVVLISGYALGGAPGFVVGAVAGLTSNFFFGQGPWTPWQMAAWGVTGAIGAGLAVITRGRTGRWSLALVCAVVGFAFVAFQDVGDWVTYSDHSAGQLGVYVGQGLGFDVLHAGGCLLFALAFGPALARAIQRFARRLQVRWEPAALATLIVILLLASVLPGQNTPIGPGQARAASDPTGYLLNAQNRDGGFGAAPGASSDPLFSGWAALALAAAGHNPLDVSRGGASLLDYVRGGRIDDVGALERTILVERAAGLGAQPDVAALRRKLGRDRSVSGQVNLTAFAVLALRAAGVPPPAATLGWLRRQENTDGGFSFATAGSPSDVDDTGAALEALGRGAPRAIAFIREQQNRDGGFPSQPGEDSNAQSTAFAIQGLLAAGVDPGSLHRRGAPSPLRYLQSLVAADGHVRYARGSDQTPVWVTAQALMALARRPLPLPPVPRTPRHKARRAAARAHPRVRVVARHRRATHLRKAVRRVVQRSPRLDRYAADLGLLTAVVLAPIGAG
jgi:energy-coupling factor transport system substrate-specific component